MTDNLRTHLQNSECEGTHCFPVILQIFTFAGPLNYMGWTGEPMLEDAFKVNLSVPNFIRW